MNSLSNCDFHRRLVSGIVGLTSNLLLGFSVILPSPSSNFLVFSLGIMFSTPPVRYRLQPRLSAIHPFIDIECLLIEFANENWYLTSSGGFAFLIILVYADKSTTPNILK